jgi:peptidoglycan hydrolase-like protein with peptidoglycan-binding domain
MKAPYLLLAAALALAGAAPALANDALFVDAQAVRQAQKTLNDRGFRTGGIDGKMGPQTQAALVNFQRAERLPPTGKLDRPTIDALGLQKGDASASAGGANYSPATIRKAQETLNARGFRAGPANGNMNDTTSTALRAFQKSESIAVTGRLNPRTLSRLGIDDNTASAGSSQRGAAEPSSATIRQVQRQLSSRGYNPGPADGVLGRATRAALMDFQRKENLPVTGQPDSATRAALGVGAGVAARR